MTGTPPHTVVVSTTVSINGVPETFTVSGETDRNPYQLAEGLASAADRGLSDWTVRQSRAWRELAERTLPTDEAARSALHAVIPKEIW